jgi:hypothetical protein
MEIKVVRNEYGFPVVVLPPPPPLESNVIPFTISNEKRAKKK